MRIQLVLVVAAAIVQNGCTKADNAPASQPAAAAPVAPIAKEPRVEAPEPPVVTGESGGSDGQAAVSAAEPPGDPVAQNAEEQALAAAYTARACVLKRLDRDGNKAIDAQYGFTDAADFASRWAAAATADPAWAEAVMAQALAKDCTPK